MPYTSKNTAYKIGLRSSMSSENTRHTNHIVLVTGVVAVRVAIVQVHVDPIAPIGRG